jgi:intracellular sulfur oxidation DsrE/DsrF family protein
VPKGLEAAERVGVSGNDADAWMDRLKGQHRVMLHVHQHFISALLDARNMLNNARDLYGVPESQYNVAVLTHGPAIQGLLGDDLWQKLALGEYYKASDKATGAPAVRNVFLTPIEGEPADATVPALMKRGVTFVVCNVAVRTTAKRMAAKNGGDPDAIYTQLAAGLVPGTFLVPDLFVSMQRAQKRGVGYLFTDRPH